MVSVFCALYLPNRPCVFDHQQIVLITFDQSVAVTYNCLRSGVTAKRWDYSLPSSAVDALRTNEAIIPHSRSWFSRTLWGAGSQNQYEENWVFHGVGWFVDLYGVGWFVDLFFCKGISCLCCKYLSAKSPINITYINVTVNDNFFFNWFISNWNNLWRTAPQSHWKPLTQRVHRWCGSRTKNENGHSD